jgi:type VII secretion protein EccE
VTDTGAALLARNGRAPAAHPLGVLAVPQIICWQLVLIAAVLIIDRPWYVITGVALAALAVLALTAVRLRGQWLYEWVGIWLSYIQRDRERGLTDSDPGPELLSLARPKAIGSACAISADTDDSMYVIAAPAGVTAVLQPRPAAADHTSTAPAAQTLLPQPDDPGLAFAVQVVQHARTGRGRPPKTWVALQALRTSEVYRDTDMHAALGNALRRVRRQLRRDGQLTRILAEDEVHTSLAALAHVNGGRGEIEERWRYWRSGPVRQAVFQLRGWSDLAPEAGAQLLRWLLGSAPEAAVTVAVTARQLPEQRRPRVDAVLRIASTGAAALDRAAAELDRLAGERGVRLERLDGRHALGVAATLPIGAA